MVWVNPKVDENIFIQANKNEAPISVNVNVPVYMPERKYHV